MTGDIDYVWDNTVDSGRFHCGVIPVNDGYAGKLQVTVVATGEVIYDEVVSIVFAARFGPDVDDVNDWQNKCIPAIDAWIAKNNGGSLMDIAEMIDAKLGDWFPCTCGPEYLNRGLNAPDCVYHEVVGFGSEVVRMLREYGHLDPLEAHRFNVVEPRHVTIEDLMRLSYQTGEAVTLEVVGGRETRERIHIDGMIFTLPADEAELLAFIDFKTNPLPPHPPIGIRR